MQLTYPLAVVALIAVTLGFAAGMLFADARRAWRDYWGRKAELPLLRAAARLATSKAAGTVALAAAIAEARMLLDVDDLRADRRLNDLVDETGQVTGQAPVPIAVVSDNGPAFKSQAYTAAFTGEDVY